MTIETKYNINDEVWFLEFHEPVCGTIICINAYVDSLGNTHVQYEFLEGNNRLERFCFPSKEELLKSTDL